MAMSITNVANTNQKKKAVDKKKHCPVTQMSHVHQHSHDIGNENMHNQNMHNQNMHNIHRHVHYNYGNTNSANVSKHHQSQSSQVVSSNNNGDVIMSHTSAPSCNISNADPQNDDNSGLRAVILSKHATANDVNGNNNPPPLESISMEVDQQHSNQKDFVVIYDDDDNDKSIKQEKDVKLMIHSKVNFKVEPGVQQNEIVDLELNEGISMKPNAKIYEVVNFGTINTISNDQPQVAFITNGNVFNALLLTNYTLVIAAVDNNDWGRNICTTMNFIAGDYCNHLFLVFEAEEARDILNKFDIDLKIPMIFGIKNLKLIGSLEPDALEPKPKEFTAQLTNAKILPNVIIELDNESE